MSDSGKPLRLDPTASGANSAQPAFLARPEGAPVYHGFPLIPETETDGWIYGAVTEFENVNGTTAGDGYVQAPDGRRAGLVWEVGHGAIAETSPPEEGRWGVYAVWFSEPIRTVDDLVKAFRLVLPHLQAIHGQLFGAPDA